MSTKIEHVAIVLGSMRAGGAERASLNLVNELVERGVRCDLVLVKKEGELLYEVNPRVNVIGLGVGRTLFAGLALCRYLKNGNPGVIIASQTHVQILCLWARNRISKHIPIILNEHSTFSTNHPETNIKSRLIRFFVSQLFPSAQAITAVSKGVSDDFANEFPELAPKLCVIFNPVVNNAVLQKSQEPLPAWFQVNKETPYILAAGRLVEDKNFDVLIEAVARVRRERKVRLVILGDGPEKEKLKTLASKLEFGKDFLMPGFEENPYKWMKQAAVFVLSSRREGLPMVLIEAMACGCKLVSTDCPSGPREILQDGIYGTLVPVGSVTSLAVAIRNSLDDSAIKINYNEALKPFMVKSIADQYTELIRKNLKLKNVSRKKNVILIGPMPAPSGGVSTHLSRILIRSANEDDLNLQVFDIRRMRLHRFDGSTRNLFIILRTLIKADIMHVHISRKLKLYIVSIARLLRKKVVYTHHNSRNLSDALTLGTMRKAHKVILVRSIVNRFPDDIREKTTIIPAYLHAMNGGELNKALVSQFSGSKVLFAHCYQKKNNPVLVDGSDIYGFDIILEAVGSLAEKMPQAKLVLFLADPADAMKEVYERKIRSLSVRQNLGIIYWNKDLDFSAALKHCSILIRATRSEGDAISVREALHAGVEVIASDCVERPEGVKLFSSGNASDLSEKLEAMIHHADKINYLQPDYAPEIFNIYRSL